MDAIRPEIDMEKYRTFTNTSDEVDEPKEPAARFCGADCRLSYREERMSNLPLPRHNVGGENISHKEMCARNNLCAYCQTKLLQ